MTDPADAAAAIEALNVPAWPSQLSDTNGDGYTDIIVSDMDGNGHFETTTAVGSDGRFTTTLNAPAGPIVIHTGADPLGDVDGVELP